MHFSTAFSLLLASGAGVLADPVLTSFPNALALSSSFDPIKAAYWTGLPHHRRTPFSVSPDGKSAYLAYLDATYSNVVVQQVDTTTFAAVGTAYSTEGYEAAGLVAQNDGFALLANINATGTTDLPPTGDFVTAIIRVKNGAEAWRTPLNGPGVHASDMLTASTDANGDLVYSEASGLYAAYFVVTAYTTDYSGHFGDSIQYCDDTGALQTIAGASSVFGCSHNTGIGLEAADAAPFASVCAEDQGDIWLNTDTQYMSGVKIANENTTNGVSGEPMGGMSGSYSNLALFPDTTNYIFAWQSRGALDLTLNEWMGTGYTQCSPRWLNHNVAVATMNSKNTLTGAEASSTVGAAEGDSQVNWITYSSTDDHQNVHVATLNSNLSIVSWETLTNPTCEPVPLSCTGTYSGTSFQFVDSAGTKVGNVVSSTSVFVSGDFANVGTDKVCWPYVEMTWDLSAPKDSATPVTSMSFACASSGDSAAVVVSSSSSVAAVKVASSSAVVESSTSAPVVSVVSVATSAADAVVVTSSPVPTTAAAVVDTPTTLASATATESSFSVEPYISVLPVMSGDYSTSTASTPVEVSTSLAVVAAETSLPASFSNPIPSALPTGSGGWAAFFSHYRPSGAATGAWGPRGTGFFGHHHKKNGTSRHSSTSTEAAFQTKAKGVAMPTGTSMPNVQDETEDVGSDACEAQYDF